MKCQFDIVCDDKFYRAHFLMTHYIGLLAGSIVCGFLCDTLGRKPVLGIGIVSMLVSMATRPFIPNLSVVTALEFLNGFGSIISYIAPFVILNELVGPEKRLFASFFVYFTFCIGNYVLLILAYIFRDWEHLMIAVSVPLAGYICVVLYLSESPRWLLSRRRIKPALIILRKMAQINNRTILLDDDIIIKHERKATFLDFLKELAKSKSLMWRLAIISLSWFSLNLMYFGITMNVARFGENVFVNFAASASAEILAIIFCWMVTDKIGRKKLFSSSMVAGGISCLCSIFTYLYADDSISWLTTTLVMVGKFFVTITFFIAFIYTAELFPTILRASAIGFASMTGRVGSISSAYIAELGTLIPTKFGKALPLIIYSIVGLISGVLSVYLPETTNIKLPENIADATNIERKRCKGKNVTRQECQELHSEPIT